jgi:hypothetical protein
MRNRRSGGAVFTALTLLGLLTTSGRAQGLFAVPELAEVGSPAPADAQALPDAPPVEPPPRDSTVWGAAGVRGYGTGDHVAPNGLEFKPLFSLELDFNFWLWRPARVYAFADSQFWGQRAAPGVTNPTQGAFDFSKREFDLSGGLAWNYYGRLEARAFAYSSNNLNRGYSAWQPSGYNDGVGIENRCYLNATYAALGTESYDVDRASFVSVGFFPTKEMVDNGGNVFKPGPFARAYVVWDLLGPRCYLYGDVELIATRSCTPELLSLDAGGAARPFDAWPRLEFRVGTDEMFDPRSSDSEPGVYGAVRFTY